MRYRLKLEEYDYKIEYTKGNDDQAVDAVSRIHITQKETDESRDLENSILQTENGTHDLQVSEYDTCIRIRRQTQHRYLLRTFRIYFYIFN